MADELPPSVSIGVRGEKRKRSDDQPAHSRARAACDACRLSKTRCDSGRPECKKCALRGLACVYPKEDPFSIFEVWGTKILAAIEDQGRMLSDFAQARQDGSQRNSPRPLPPPSVEDDDDPETTSRKDSSQNPITGSDRILGWSVFPDAKPVSTFPASAYIAKPNPSILETTGPSPTRMLELREIFMTEILPKGPIVDAEQLDGYIAGVLENGFDWSASSCLVLLVCALAAACGTYPEDGRRTLLPDESRDSEGGRPQVTMAIPGPRMEESRVYLSMAQQRIMTAYLDDSLLGVICHCLFGTWHQYNMEPIQGWKMFRTASMLWEAYSLKHAHGKTQRSKQEESLEARLYWTCLKCECDLRNELTDLPSCTLQESSFPLSLPTFPTVMAFDQSTLDTIHHGSSSIQSTPSSYYYLLGEISLRRLLNRTRHAATLLSPNIDSATATRLANSLLRFEDQLQQWLDCLPPALRFNIPPDTWPPPNEPELIKLMRERYVEARELICRAYLYMCLHGGTRLTRSQAKTYGAYASVGLRLSVYRIQTEVPFFRHAGSWGACRVRFNQALCLLAAVRGSGIESAAYVVVPPSWRECVGLVQDRLETWSDQGGGIAELNILLKWLKP